MRSLPIDEVLPELLDTLRTHGVVILQAPPGAGKSTRVPPAILDSDLCDVKSKIVMLEPRRVAARAVAARIAEERGQRPGDGEVGYSVRFDRKVSASTRLEVVTEGLLLRRLQHDPFLEDVGCVILDEFHERSLHADLAIAMLKELRMARPELKLVVMSATLQMEPLQRYLDAPAVTSKGRTFPVTMIHAPIKKDLYSDVYGHVEEFASLAGEQDALVFLPGAMQIEQQITRLEPLAKRHAMELYPLYGALSLEEQIRAITPSTTGKRRVIVATNIAETSLTVEGVTTVIDSGLVKQLRSDPDSGLDRLVETEIAQDSATQRAGRAGRVRPGRAVRLWSETSQDLKAAQTEPDIRRVDVLTALLEVCAWSGASPATFDWFEPPTSRAIAANMELLRQLGLLPSGEGEVASFALTPLGELVRQLPLHPRLGRMICEGVALGVEEHVAIAAAILSEDVTSQLLRGGRTGSHQESDLWLAIQRYRRDGRRILGGSSWRVKQVEEQILKMIRGFDQGVVRELRRGNREQETLEERLTRCVLAGFPDRICLRQDDGTTAENYIMTGGHALTLARESAARGATWLVAVHNAGVRHVSGYEHSSGVRERGLIRMACPVERDTLEELFADRFEQHVEVAFDAEKERFTAKRVERFDGLFLSSVPISLKQHVSKEELARAMAEVIVSRGLKRAFSPDTDAEQLMFRAELLRRHRPSLGLPNLLEPDEETIETLTRWCWGKSGLGEVRKAGLTRFIEDTLTYAQRQALEELVPSRVRVPSGSALRVDYSDGPDAPPVLAVRIQEVFGWQKTPTILQGEVALMCHLLAPNYRPAQVTQDLESFWHNTYPEVRKELRARYPKHAWPEDPLQARAVKKGASSIKH